MEIPQELIERCRNGNRKAVNELYKSLCGFLMSVCRRYIRQEEKQENCSSPDFAACASISASTSR